MNVLHLTLTLTLGTNADGLARGVRGAGRRARAADPQGHQARGVITAYNAPKNGIFSL